MEHNLSIIARCTKNGDLGAFVLSSHPASGAYTPFISRVSGIISLTGWFYPGLIQEGAKHLKRGMTANYTLEKLLILSREYSICVLDNYGNGAAYTGCDHDENFSGHLVGQHYVIQGQTLPEQHLIHEVQEKFESLEGDLSFRMRGVIKDLLLERENLVNKFRSAVFIIARDPVIPYIHLRVDSHQNPAEEIIKMYDYNEYQLRRRFLKSLGEKEHSY